MIGRQLVLRPSPEGATRYLQVLDRGPNPVRCNLILAHSVTSTVCKVQTATTKLFRATNPALHHGLMDKNPILLTKGLLTGRGRSFQDDEGRPIRCIRRLGV